MKANVIMEKLFSLANVDHDYTNTCDTCKSGDPQREVSKVAVTMFPTPQVIRDASFWGAELLIVHEPLYYNHMDNYSNDEIEEKKRELVNESGLTMFRFHDHPHYTKPDIIAKGMLEAIALDGRTEHTDSFDLVRVYPSSPITPRELARMIEERCGIKHIRISGAADVECNEVSCMFGAPGTLAFDELKSKECEILITGEICEWSMGEYARDAAQLGYKKAVLVLGHAGSERDGMKYTAELVKEAFPQLEVKYFECDEVYTYTD